MNAAETWTYGILLVVSLGFAHQSWKGEDVAVKEETIVFDTGKGQVDEINWEGEKNLATLSFEGKDDDTVAWITAGKRKKVLGPPIPAAASDDDSADADASSPAPKKGPPRATYGAPELKNFPGNKQAVDLRKRYSPLTALRQFDDLEAATIEEMGLTEPKAKLRLRQDTRELFLEIGEKAYGSSDTYVRVKDTSTVYLLDSKALGPLRSAQSRLLDRKLIAKEPVDFATARIQRASGGEAEAALQGRHDKENAFWSRPGEASEPDTVLDGFLKKLFQLRASSYPNEDKQISDSEVEVLMTVALQGEDAGAKIVLARKVDEKRSRDGDPAYTWYAKTAQTRQQWVKVNSGTSRDLADALPEVLGG